MPINILMPALSPTMTEGTLAKWHVKEGDEVTSGDVIAEIETDKATMEVEAVEEGRIGKILVGEGAEGVAVNNVIAVLLEEGEEESAMDTVSLVAPAPAARHPVMDEGGGNTGGGKDTAGRQPFPDEGPGGDPKPEPTPTPKPNGGAVARHFSSPLARRMAKMSGIDLTGMTGSGPRGRVVKADIDAILAGGGAPKAAATPAAAPAPAAAAPAAIAPAGPGAKQLADLLGMAHRQEGLSNMRKTIARRLTEAKQTVPHFYLTVDCRIDELLKIRKEINSRFEDQKISVNDFVIRASAMALKQIPAANASWDDSGMIFYDHADISVAVATPNGLITPVIKAAENKGLAAISKEMKDLAARARDGKLKPEEYQGGSFSVSNLGMFGIKEFAAIINPPQGCILAVGAGVQQPVVQDGEIAVATVMSCTLSVDHRVVDGAVGAQFLAAFKKLIEYPPTMLL